MSKKGKGGDWENREYREDIDDIEDSEETRKLLKGKLRMEIGKDEKRRQKRE